MPGSPTQPAPRPVDATGESELNDLLWECATYVELMGEAALADVSLTLPSSGLLITVRAQPGITVAEIARRKPKTQQAVSQVVARLERLGLLERRLRSGRGVGLYLTEAGEQKAREGLKREGELQRQLRELLGSERYGALEQLLLEAREILRENR